MDVPREARTSQNQFCIYQGSVRLCGGERGAAYDDEHGVCVGSLGRGCLQCSSV